MSFIAYFIVLVLTAGAALFGLDVLTAPLPEAPATHAVAQTKSNKLANYEAGRRQADHGAKPGALSPVYPAHPGEKIVRAVEPANAVTRVETDGAALSASAAPNSPAPNPPMQQPTSPPLGAQASTQPAVGSCNIEACAAGYRSFRVSDCSYQPYEGPRRQCVSPPAAQHSASAALELRSVRHRAHDDALDAVAAKEITSRHYSSYSDEADDGDDDGGAPRGFIIPPLLDWLR